MTTRRRLSAARYAHAYYALARSLGLCGRCKRQDALPDMAYCRVCHAANRGYNHKRKGPPRKVYESKFTRMVSNELD
jgi:hypothetical protein